MDDLGVFRGERVAVALRIDEVIAIGIFQHRLTFRLPLSEGIGNVFQENRAEHGVLINGSVKIGPQPFSSGPELIIELAEEGLEIGWEHFQLKTSV